MQYCYSLRAIESPPSYATTSLSVHYETSTYTAYGQYGSNGANFYQDPTIYYGKIPVKHYNLQGNMAQNTFPPEVAYRAMEGCRPSDGMRPYYPSDYTSEIAESSYWYNADGYQDALRETAIQASMPATMPETPIATTPPPTAPLPTMASPSTGAARQQSRVPSPNAALCDSPTLTSPIPRNLYYSPNHFLQMVQSLQIESQQHVAQQPLESINSSDEDENEDEDKVFDLKAERNKKMGKMLKDTDIKYRFSKVSQDCTSLFKILDRLTNTREGEMVSLASQERTISESLSSLSPTNSKTACGGDKAHHVPLDEVMYPRHYESPVYYDVPHTHQVACEKHSEKEAPQNPEVQQNQTFQNILPKSSNSPIKSRRLKKGKTKRSTHVSTTPVFLANMRERSKEKQTLNLNSFFVNNDKRLLHQIIDQDLNSVEMNDLFLARTQAICHRISKEKEDETLNKIKDASRNPVPSNTQLRAEVRAALKKFKLKANEMGGNVTYKRKRLRKGSAKSSVPGIPLPKLSVPCEVPSTTLPKKADGTKEGDFLPPIGEGRRKGLPPRQNGAQFHSKIKSSSEAKLPLMTTAAGKDNASPIRPTGKEVPVTILHPIPKERHVRKKHASSASGTRNGRKPLPSIDMKLSKRRPFK